VQLGELPAEFALPHGRLILAATDTLMAGCVAYRALDSYSAELKRLFVRPRAQGLGVGRALVKEAIQQARATGYRSLKLNTLKNMTSAITLYRALGFAEIAPYVESEDVDKQLFFEIALA